MDIRPSIKSSVNGCSNWHKHGCEWVPTMAAACGLGHSVIAHGLVAGASGGGIGCGIATIIESAFIWRQFCLDRISFKEALALTGVSLLSNAAAGIGFFGVMAIGAAAGTPGGPVGVGIGVAAAIVAGLLFGLNSILFR